MNGAATAGRYVPGPAVGVLARLQLLDQDVWWVPRHGWFAVLGLIDGGADLAGALARLSADQKVQVRYMDRPWRSATAAMLLRTGTALWAAHLDLHSASFCAEDRRHAARFRFNGAEARRWIADRPLMRALTR